MATLLLTAVGTAIGGPLGGALGAFIGQQADRAVFGSGSREGPRLKELAVTTSSYGQPISRNFGQMRVAGTVIWATDLVEGSTTQGGKGQPKTTTYSYSANFAVALSSTPIARIGRIWADGNLLRGANGDLKASGQLRFYNGHGDALVDPLVEADKGDEAPAFRDCAYVVFEDLQLADFGNRIPALTFEIFADGPGSVSLSQLVPGASQKPQDTPLASALGFSDQGGALAGTLSAIDRVYPLSCITTPAGLQLSSALDHPASVPILSEPLLPRGEEEGRSALKKRSETQGAEPMALRYYDLDRDYQPGVQRAIGLRANGRETILDLPAAMTADGAKLVANHNARNARWRHETLLWRTSELDPDVRPGSVVRLSDRGGFWLVRSWEWFEHGIELQLERLATGLPAPGGSDSGAQLPPSDLALAQTQVLAFEAPPEDTSSPSASVVLVAASSSSPAWKGASLFVEYGDALEPIGSTNALRAVIGSLVDPLAPSASHYLEQNGVILVQLAADDLEFTGSNIQGLAAGANRLLIGSEVVQFLQADPLGSGIWRLTGLLRGRAGTEEQALSGHLAQTPVVALDQRITDISYVGLAPDLSTRIGAIGQGDSEAVIAALANPGLSRRPPTPVHPRTIHHMDGSIEYCWSRRARGQWRWDTPDEVPLVEEFERYRIGYGAVNAPYAVYTANNSRIIFSSTEINALIGLHGPAAMWVKQIGTYSSSGALHLSHIQ